MMRHLLSILLLLCCTGSLGQNLVTNGDFEQYTSCPTNQSQIENVNGWTSATDATPDFFHTCNSDDTEKYGIVSTPINLFGYQKARSGKGYSGIYIWAKAATINYREYIEVRLTQPLVAGNRYSFEMYINVPDEFLYTSDQVGVYFSDIYRYVNTYDILPLDPQIKNKKGNRPDTSGWTKVSAEYMATGKEQYIIIGAFNDESSVDTVAIGPIDPSKLVYFFLDDVSLTEYPLPPNPPLDTSFNNNPKPPKPSGNCISIPNAFSPDNDGRNDRFAPIFECEISRYTLKIFNRFGQEVFYSNNPSEHWDGTFKGQDLNVGVYYYFTKVLFNYYGAKEEMHKGDISLLR